MRQYITQNFSEGLLATAVGLTDLTLTVDAGHSLPVSAGNFVAIIWNNVQYADPGKDPGVEIVLATYVSGNTYSIVRAQEGTVANEHNIGSVVGVYLTAGMFNQVADAGVPPGGETGQFLVKNSGTDYDTEWLGSTTPANVTNFDFSWGESLYLTWSANTEANLLGYEIRDEDANWGVYSVHQIFKGNAIKFAYAPSTRSPGTFYIRAYNSSGTYSDVSNTTTPTLPAPSAPISLGSVVIFNMANFYWADLDSTTVIYYEVWKSYTDAWSGEQELVARVSGTSCELNSKSPWSGVAESGSTVTLVDSSLIGFDDDYFVGATLSITAGSASGQSAIVNSFDGVTGTLGFSPLTVSIDNTSEYQLTDNVYVRVRAVDRYGAGSFSTSLLIAYQNLSETMIGNNAITARQIYVACLSAISENVGYLTAGVLQGVTMRTAATGARTVFSSSDFRSYDAADNIMFEVKDGNVTAKTMTLQDPNCCYCYSYLSAGQWYFHDELGNETPYVKRLCAGEACTGATVCLAGWKGQPYIQIGIKDLAAYDPNYSVNCQKWCVYYNGLTCYVNSASDYGWCFTAHASLYKAAGEYPEDCVDVALDTSVYTHNDACWTRVRNRFLLWCFCSTCSTCYGYGVLCYRIKYKCCEAGCAWTCCDYLYTQSHDSTSTLKTCYDICQNICFPSTGCWELQLNCLSLAWCLTTLTSVTTCCCSRNICCCIDNRLWDNTSPGGIYYSGTQQIISCCAVLSGTKPDNVYCTYLCYCATMDLMTCVRAIDNWYQCALGYICFQGCNLLTGSLICNYKLNLIFCYTANQSCYQCMDFTACNTCLFDYIYMYTCTITCTHQGICVVAQNTACICTINLIHCYCSVPSNCICEYERLWSTKDYSEAQTILDPNGVLNYLAIGYS